MAGSLSMPCHLIQDIHCINFLRLARLLTRGATSVLTNLFKVYCPPSVDLSSSFDTTFSFTLFEERCHSQEFDTTLVFPLLREKCGLLPPPTGWNALPNDDDMSLSADIARIKCYRNQIYKHANEKEAKLTDTEFECCKENTVNSLRRIVRDYSGTDWEAVAAWEKSVGECLTSPITEEDESNVEKLKTWYLKDVEEEQLQSSETETTEQWGDAIKEVYDTRNGEGEGEKQYVGSKGDLKDVEREQLQSDKIETTKQSFDTIKGVTDERNEKEEKNDAGSNGYLEHVVEKHPQSTYVVIKEKYEEMKNLLIGCYSSGLMYVTYFAKNTLWENGHRKSSTKSKKEAEKKYHFAKGIKDVNSGRYIDAISNFHRALKSLPPEEVLLRAGLENNIGCSYLFAKKPDMALMTLKNAIQKMNCVTQTFEKDSNFTGIANIRFSLRNNYACVELENRNSEEALSIFRNLYEEEKVKSLKNAKLQEKDPLPRVAVEQERELGLSYNHHSIASQRNLVHVVMNYSQACLQSGKMENIVEVLQDVLHGCHFTEEEYNLQLVVSVRLARILTVMGKRKQAGELVDLQEIDSLKIQKIIESDSMKPFSVIYTDDISRILVYNGERSKSKELLQTAIQVCQEMHFKEHPLVLSLEKTKEELFPTLVIEKAALALEEDNISRHKVAINVCVEYALQVLQHESDRESLLAELNALKSVASDEKSFADMYTSEKQLASSTQIPAVAFISTLYICAFLSQQEKSDNKVETYLRNQLARIESFCDDLKENAVSKFVISFLSDNRSCALSALCSLLETALLRHAHTCVVNICTTLVSCLSRGSEEDVSEVEWYKDYCGLLSYFVATNHVQISGKKITLYVIVTSGSGLKGPEEVGFLPDKKPLFKRIVLHDTESEECPSSCTQETNSKCFVFLRCHDLIDINDLRHINKTIIESTQSLESLPTNARYQRSLFIEVVQEIDPADVSGSCLQLNLLKCCFEGIDTDCHGPVNVPSVQNLYLQKLQKPLSFKNESDLAVFMAVFQYTFSNIRLVDVLHKTRKKMVCILKQPHFSLLTLHTKASTAYLALHDVSDKCFGDGTIATEATHLIDVVIGDCFEKLCISSIDPKNPWRIYDPQIDECPIFFAEEEDAFEKALKTNARVTAELEYLQTKTRSLNSRLKKLYDNLSEAENRVFLLQHFAHATFSDRNKMKAVENWITKKKTRQAGPKEGPSNDEDDELEEFLESISNDELAEFLAEIQRPDLVSVSLKDKTSDESMEMSLNEDVEGAGCFTSSDKRRIVEEEKIEGANGKSLDQRLCNDDVEGKDSSDNLSWYFPLPESTQHFPSINIAAEQSELPILREEFTQTDSLSLVQEYKDVDVQTDPTQLTSEETLEKGIADFERDRAERQLRKSRLSQDVIAFKNRPRESAPGSSQGSIVTQTSGFFSGGTPRDSISSGSLPLESFSECSILSEASSLGTEDIPSEGTLRDSISSGSSLLESFSKYSIVSKASSLGTEDVPSEGTSRDSIAETTKAEASGNEKSMGNPLNVHLENEEYDDMLQIEKGISIAQESGDKVAKMNAYKMLGGAHLEKEEYYDAILYGSSQDSIVTETSVLFSEGTLRDSITSGSLPLESLSKCSVVSEASSHGTEDVSSEGTPEDSSSGFMSGRSSSRSSIISGSSGHGKEDVSNEGSITTGAMPKHVTETTEAEESESEQSLGDSSSGFSSIKGSNCVEPEKEILHSTLPDGKKCLNTVRDSGYADSENENDFIVNSDKCDTARESDVNKPDTNEKRVPILLTEKLGVEKASLVKALTGPKEARKEYLDVKSNKRISTDDVKSSSDGANNELDIGSITVASNVVLSCAKPHKNDESLAEDKLQKSERSQEGPTKFLWKEQRNVTGTTNNEDAVSLDNNADRTVSSFRNGDYMSLPTKVLHEVSNTEKRSDRIHSLVFSNMQQDDKASLSVIKETDDSEDIDDIWNSQGARPKRIGLHGDYIVSGVDNSFLARHSNDSSLTRSVYSRTRVHNKHKPFSSLPVCSNERVEVPSVARTWPICDDRLLTDQNTSSSVNDKSRLPYQGLPRETGKKPMRSFDTGRYSCKKQTKNEYSSKVQIYGNNLYTVREGHFDAKTSEKKKGKDSMSDDLLSDAKGIAADDDGDSGGNDGKADGNGLRYIGKHEDAQKCFERALAIEEMEYDQNHPTLAITLSNLGNSLRDLGKHEEAHKCFERALAIEEMAYDQNHPTLATTLSNLGNNLGDLGKHQEAQKCFERALTIQEMAYDQNHPTLAITLNNLAKSSEKAKGKDSMKHGVLSEAKGIAADDDSDVGIGDDGDGDGDGGDDGDGDDGKVDGNGEAHENVASPESHSDVPSTISTEALPGSHSDVASTTGTPTLPGSHSDVPSTTDTPLLPGNHSDVQMKEQFQVAFDDIHTPRSPNTFGSPTLFNSERSSNGIIDLSPTQDTNTSSSTDDSYETADSSMESLESLEDQVKRSAMIWSQMSESVRFEHEEDDEQEESLNEDMQTEHQGETERRTLVAASGEGDEMNANKSEIKGDGKNGTNGKSVESGGRVMRLINWAKNLGRTEKETRETDLEKGATSLSQRQDFTREDMNTQAVDQLTSLSTQRVSADVYDARERELRTARAREREERNKKEKEEIERRLEASQKEKERSSPSSPQPARLPVQESRNEWPCSHYKRKCSIKFPCCEQFYFCHRCHNDSDQCEKDNMKALNGTHLCCLVCNKEQEITENSHHCINCNTQLAEYFCSICKHFTGNEKTPYHCGPCGICRIHRDRSFHCNVCNVCLDVRLLDNHKCRPDSGHDECCICLEDAFGGCQILPCSHKVHRECAVAMLKNGVRKCPVCRHPLNLPLQR